MPLNLLKNDKIAQNEAKNILKEILEYILFMMFPKI